MSQAELSNFGYDEVNYYYRKWLKNGNGPSTLNLVHHTKTKDATVCLFGKGFETCSTVRLLPPLVLSPITRVASSIKVQFRCRPMGVLL